MHLRNVVTWSDDVMKMMGHSFNSRPDLTYEILKKYACYSKFPLKIDQANTVDRTLHAVATYANELPRPTGQ
jgi:hypothetical protein